MTADPDFLTAIAARLDRDRLWSDDALGDEQAVGVRRAREVADADFRTVDRFTGRIVDHVEIHDTVDRPVADSATGDDPRIRTVTCRAIWARRGRIISACNDTEAQNQNRKTHDFLRCRDRYASGAPASDVA